MPLGKQWRSQKILRKEVNAAYRLYLHSKHWREVKTKALESAKGYCQKCGRKSDRLNVHHKTYETIGHENPGDLLVLCPKCHAATHKEKWW
jgi:hypothetical protein